MPVFKRFPSIPKFTLIKCPDNSVVTRDDLKKDPTLVIYFSPTCEHCKKATAELLAHKDELKKKQVLMVSTLPMNQISDFYYEMHLQAEPEVIVGMDAKYFFPVFYQVQQLPALFVYDKKGQLLSHPATIAEALKTLKL